MTHSGKTTVQSKSVVGEAKTELVYALRWVHPEEVDSLSLLVNRTLTLGRDEDSDFVLRGNEASRNHAEITRSGVTYVLRDLKSTNGVFCNGNRVDEITLSEGDVLRMGEWIGVVTRCPSDQTSGQMPVRAIATNLYGGADFERVLEPARKIAKKNLPVIIVGETGTGKERIAQTIHRWSGRGGRFVGINCAALPETLAEGELFGYRKGAFTGADRENPGHFRSADKGTLLLDEINELSIPLQAKLLRVLEENEVQPLGESQAVPIDVRILCATQEDLPTAVSENKFRTDLYARLNGLKVIIPPLRERIGDVPGLFSRFIHIETDGRPPKVATGLIEQLCLYDWPFNIRELQLLTRRLLALHGQEPELQRRHLPSEMLVGFGGENEARAKSDNETRVRTDQENQEEFDLRALVIALRKHKGNVAKAAREVGISRQRAYRLMNSSSEINLQAYRHSDGARSDA